MSTGFGLAPDPESGCRAGWGLCPVVPGRVHEREAGFTRFLTKIQSAPKPLFLAARSARRPGSWHLRRWPGRRRRRSGKGPSLVSRAPLSSGEGGERHRRWETLRPQIPGPRPGRRPRERHRLPRPGLEGRRQQGNGWGSSSRTELALTGLGYRGGDPNKEGAGQQPLRAPHGSEPSPERAAQSGIEVGLSVYLSPHD